MAGSGVRTVIRGIMKSVLGVVGSKQFICGEILRFCSLTLREENSHTAERNSPTIFYIYIYYIYLYDI